MPEEQSERLTQAIIESLHPLLFHTETRRTLAEGMSYEEVVTACSLAVYSLLAVWCEELEERCRLTAELIKTVLAIHNADHSGEQTTSCHC